MMNLPCQLLESNWREPAEVFRLTSVYKEIRFVDTVGPDFTRAFPTWRSSQVRSCPAGYSASWWPKFLLMPLFIFEFCSNLSDNKLTIFNGSVLRHLPTVRNLWVEHPVVINFFCNQKTIMTALWCFSRVSAITSVFVWKEHVVLWMPSLWFPHSAWYSCSWLFFFWLWSAISYFPFSGYSNFPHGSTKTVQSVQKIRLPCSA